VPRIQIDPDLCKGCELCVRACPQKVLVMGSDINSKGYFFAQVGDPMRCLGCRMCCIACADLAIRMHVHGTMVHYFAY
jgi:2-oxoglutarate ferredoxin oxidoreductase subunit delta